MQPPSLMTTSMEILARCNRQIHAKCINKCREMSSVFYQFYNIFKVLCVQERSNCHEEWIITHHKLDVTIEAWTFHIKIMFGELRLLCSMFSIIIIMRLTLLQQSLLQVKLFLVKIIIYQWVKIMREERRNLEKPGYFLLHLSFFSP